MTVQFPLKLPLIFHQNNRIISTKSIVNNFYNYNSTKMTVNKVDKKKHFHQNDCGFFKDERSSTKTTVKKSL